MATSSEQAAAPATPSTLKSLPITPANLEATPQPYRCPCMHVPKPLCIAHNFQSGRVVHPGTSPPSPRAQPVHLWGLRGRPRQSRGSDNSRRRCTSTHSETSTVQSRHLRLETADAEALEPCMLAEAKRSPGPHELATRTHPCVIAAEAPCAHRSRHTSTPYLSRSDHRVIVEVVELRVVHSSGCLSCTRTSRGFGDLGDLRGFGVTCDVT